MFRLFFSRFILSRLGRSADFFQYVANTNIAKTLLDRTEYGLTALPVKNNFYAEYILTGRFRNLFSAPLYLNPNNYEVIKNRLHRFKLVCSSLEDYLKQLPIDSISKFNLSDCFEYLSTNSINQIIELVLKVARPETRIALWTLFIPQPIPKQYQSRLQLLNRMSAQLSSRAQTFFYNNFCLWQVKGR